MLSVYRKSSLYFFFITCVLLNPIHCYALPPQIHEEKEISFTSKFPLSCAKCRQYPCQELSSNVIYLSAEALEQKVGQQDFSYRDKEENTLLHWAAFHNRADLIEKLKNSTIWGAINKHRHTALMVAVQWRKQEAAIVLCQGKELWASQFSLCSLTNSKDLATQIAQIWGIARFLTKRATGLPIFSSIFNKELLEYALKGETISSNHLKAYEAINNHLH